MKGTWGIMMHLTLMLEVTYVQMFCLFFETVVFYFLIAYD